MRPMTKVGMLAAAAMLIAACSSDPEPAATTAALTAPADLSTPIAAESGSPAASAGPSLDRLSSRMDQAEARIAGLEARLGEVEPSDLQSRLSEAEDQIRLLSEAVEELQAPTNLMGPTASPEESAEPAASQPAG